MDFNKIWFDKNLRCDKRFGNDNDELKHPQDFGIVLNVTHHSFQVLHYSYSQLYFIPVCIWMYVINNFQRVNNVEKRAENVVFFVDCCVLRFSNTHVLVSEIINDPNAIVLFYFQWSIKTSFTSKTGKFTWASGKGLCHYFVFYCYRYFLYDQQESRHPTAYFF